VWADIDSATGLIDPDDVARKLTHKTRAIIGVDWGGAPCDWSALRAFGVPVIEDAAHALLTPPGGDYTCYSFQAIKHLTTGDGGALACPSAQTERARLLRWYGLDRRARASFRCEQDIHELGFKYHMNDIAAAIGLANIAHAEWIVAQHQANASYYYDTLPAQLLPPRPARSSWWIFTLLVSDRAAFIVHMAERGIAAGQVHRRNDAHPAFALASRDGILPGVDHFDARNVAIPVGWWLTPAARDRVADAVLDWSLDHVAAS